MQQSLKRRSLAAATFITVLATTSLLHAQSPWERSALRLADTFTGPLARAFALVAIVVGGVTFMFGEGGSSRTIAGIIFGGGLALAAPQFVAWLF